MLEQTAAIKDGEQKAQGGHPTPPTNVDQMVKEILILAEVAKDPMRSSSLRVECFQEMKKLQAELSNYMQGQ